MANVSNTVIAAEYFSESVQKRLNSDNSFLSLLTNVNQYVTGGKSLHIPNAGSGGTVTIDGAISQSGEDTEDFTDTDVTAVLSYARLKPFVVNTFDETVTNYNVFGTQFNTNISKLAEVVADNIIYKITDNASKVTLLATTGGAGTANAPNGQNKKKFILADVRKLQTALNKQNVPKNNRVLLVNSIMLSELMEDTTVVSMLTNTESGAQKLMSGAIGMLCGFIIVDRDWTGILTTSNVAQTRVTAEASTDKYTAIAFQSDYIVYANTAPIVFYNEKVARSYGDEMSAEMYFTAKLPRTDLKGVVMIAQG